MDPESQLQEGHHEKSNWFARLYAGYGPPAWSRSRLTPSDEEQFLDETWSKNRLTTHVFALIVFLHTVFVNIVYSVIFETSPYRNGIVYGVLYPISLAVLVGSFLNPLSTRLRRGLWYTGLSIESVMMACQISIKNILCYFEVEAPESCNPAGRPLIELQWVYVIVGPLLLLNIMRNHWLTQLSANFAMFALIVWSITTGYSTAEPFSEWSALVFAVGGNVLALFVAWRRDLTERMIFEKEKLNERLHNNLRAEMAERAEAQQNAAREEGKRNQFTSYIFHEIRNPLNTIILSMELLDIDDELKSHTSVSVAENFSRIRVALTSIESIINDTLDLRKMNEGKLSLNPRPFDFHRMIRTSVWTMESTWMEKKVSLTMQLDEKIAQLPQLIGDETRLHQVLTNYLSNAVKFTPSGGTITLSTSLNARDSTRPENADITVTVSDSGIGIAEGDQKKLFQEFVQIDPERNQGGKGTGLGLSICAGIVRSMGGEYGVRSQEGKGSSFYFRISLPKSDKPLGTQAIDKPAQPPPIAPVANSTSHEIDRAFKLAILVTDDDPMQRRIMTQLLSRIGHTVHTAEDGVNCLEKVAMSIALDIPYDVIFIDNQMPRLTGGDTIRVLRRCGVATHIISFTATAETELHESLRQAGATEILVKPSSKALINKALRMLPFPDKLPKEQHEQVQVI